MFPGWSLVSLGIAFVFMVGALYFEEPVERILQLLS